MDKYSKVHLLVHPFFYPYFVVNWDNNSRFEYNKVMKILLGVYGKEILRIAKDPNACLVIVNPYYDKLSHVNVYNPFYERYLSPFLEFAKRILGNRLYITDYDPGFKESKPIMQKEFEKRLEKDVTVEAFGEYYDECVTQWSKEFVKQLKDLRINVNLNIDLSRSLPYHENDPILGKKDSLWFRLKKKKPKINKPKLK